MKLDVAKLPFTKAFELSEEISFDPDVFVCHYPLKKVESCYARIRTQRFEEFIYVTISIQAKVILNCAYSLQDFKSIISGSDEIHFAPDQDEDDDCIVYKGNVIDLDEYIFNLLSASVPLSPKAPGAKVPQANGDYRVISEEDYYKEKEEAGNSAFDALKDLEF